MAPYRHPIFVSRLGYLAALTHCNHKSGRNLAGMKSSLTYLVHTALDKARVYRSQDLEHKRNEGQVLHRGRDGGYLVEDVECLVLVVGRVDATLGAAVAERRDGVEGEAAGGVPEGDPVPLAGARTQLLDPPLCVGVDHVLHAEEVPPREGVRDEALLGRVGRAV